MHKPFQGNDGQSNRSGKSLSTFRPNTVEATVFKIVDGRLHSGVLTAHSSKGFTLFAVLISLAEVALLGQDVVNKQFIKAGAVRLAVESAPEKVYAFCSDPSASCRSWVCFATTYCRNTVPTEQNA